MSCGSTDHDVREEVGYKITYDAVMAAAKGACDSDRSSDDDGMGSFEPLFLAEVVGGGLLLLAVAMAREFGKGEGGASVVGSGRAM